MCRFLFVALAAAIAFTGCGGASSLQTRPQSGAARPGSTTASPIEHVVLVIQENRSFNDFFATFPNADGTTTGTIEKFNNPHCKVTATGPIALTESPLVTKHDLNHRFSGYNLAYDHGNMDGFDKALFQDGLPECKYAYQYTNPNDIVPYWQMAQQYTLAEHMFTTQGSSSFVAHQNLIRGSTQVNPEYALVNDPTGIPWGCDAPAGAKTSLITQNNIVHQNAGPFPCSNHFPSVGGFDDGYRTLRDVLDAKGVLWKYYVPPISTIYGKLMSAFDVVAPVRYGPEWATNVITPQTQIFSDITNNALPAMSWVIPDEPDSDHPGETVDHGPQWVASIVNAIGESPYWNSTAIVIVWDDWGGLYDNLAPKQMGFGGLGFRVPAIVVSPYAKAGYISTTNYEFGSILKYVENNFGLNSIGTTDQRATSIIDCFDYSQTPITFVPISSSLSKAYFIHRRPSLRPIDDDM